VCLNSHCTCGPAPWPLNLYSAHKGRSEIQKKLATDSIVAPIQKLGQPLVLFEPLQFWQNVETPPHPDLFHKAAIKADPDPCTLQGNTQAAPRLATPRLEEQFCKLRICRFSICSNSIRAVNHQPGYRPQENRRVVFAWVGWIHRFQWKYLRAR